MKLLMTTDVVGGVWQYATDLATALVPHGVETVIAVLGPGFRQGALRHPLPSGEGKKITVVSTGLPLDWLADGPEPVLAAGDAIAALAREVGADLVQLNSPALAARARFPVPVVAVEHGCAATWWQGVHATPLPADLAWQRDLARDGLRRAAAVVAPSAAHAAAVRHAYRLDHAPLAIHNGRRAYPLPAGVKSGATAFTAGRLWDEAKRIGVLDAAAALAATPIRAAGPCTGPERQRVTPAHLACLGTLSDDALAATLAARPIFVSTAVFEPFGLAVLEAAQAGCALVLADIATFRELWDGAASFVAADHAAGFAAAIDALAASPAHRARLGTAAAVRARRYTPEASAAAMAALYARLLAGSERAAA